MITYAERSCFRQAHQRLLVRVQGHVSRVSNSWGNELRCHELARAVAEVLNDVTLEVVDGKCGPVEHTWLVLSDGAILDPYVPGRLPAVQLIDPIVSAPYRPGENRNDIRPEIVSRLVFEMRVAL